MSETSNISPLHVIPLGGLGEIGKNMWLFRYKNEIIVIDCGLMFPSEEMYGVDFVLPDITYAIENQQYIKALIITHGHEDHIGGLSYFLHQLNDVPPIYGTKLTLGLVEDRLDHGLKEKIQWNEIKPRDKIELGNFTIEFLRVCHSIPDGIGMAIHTPVGIIIYTGDFKLDPTPIDGEITDLYKFAEYGEKGVLLLMSDSTNAERQGFTPSERQVGIAFKDIFYKARGRIIVTTFATNIHRIQQVINSAIELGRKIAVIGRSLERVVHKAMTLGYIYCPVDSFIRASDIFWYNDDQIVLITTGSQGEPMSVLNRMANRDHKYINVVPGDTVVISAHPIPGNERLVYRTINKLFTCGAEVVYESYAGMHVSGHASQEELKMMLNLTKPKFFIPTHGEHRHLIHHADLAASLNVNADNIMIIDNGDIVEFTPDSAIVIGQVPTGMVMIDGSGVGHVGDKILKDRRDLSREGVILMALTIDNTGKLIATPKITSKGFIVLGNEETVYQKAGEIIKAELNSEWEKNSSLSILDIERISTRVFMEFAYRQTKRHPIIVPAVQQISCPGSTTNMGGG